MACAVLVAGSMRVHSRDYLLPIAVVATLLCACGSSTSVPPPSPLRDAYAVDESSPDTLTSDDSAIDVTMSDTLATDTSSSDALTMGDSPSDSSSTDTGDASIAADASSSCDAGTQVSSRQTVNLVVTNQASSDRFVVSAGNLCDPFAIATAGGPALPLTLGFQCICECPRPGSPGPLALHRVAAGASLTLTWDARTIATCPTQVDCTARGWPNTPPATQLLASASPVAPGSYVATVGAFALATLPAGCLGNGSTYTCPPNGSGVPSLAAVQQMCPSSVTASATFTLPSSGDVSVPIVITQ